MRIWIQLASIAVWALTIKLALAQDFSGYYTPATPHSVEQLPAIESLESLPVDSAYQIPSKIPSHKLRRIDGAAVQQDHSIQIGSDPRYKQYRVGESITSYMPGDGEQFGWLDFENTPFLAGSQTSGITLGSGLHLLSGPNSVPLPPRLWDFVLGYQTRGTIQEHVSFDLAYSLGVYSDFEDSAREGVRSLGHAVGVFHKNDRWDWVLGVDYLNRDDYKILPVAGFSWHSPDFPNWTMDLVFPRPRVDFALSSKERVYIGGFLGGGTWDIEMPGDVNDVMTYRDFRLIFGLERLHEKGRMSGLELGYVFGRQVDFRTLQPGVEFDDGFVIRWVSRH